MTIVVLSHLGATLTKVIRGWEGAEMTAPAWVSLQSVWGTGWEDACVVEAASVQGARGCPPPNPLHFRTIPRETGDSKVPPRFIYRCVGGASHTHSEGVHFAKNRSCLALRCRHTLLHAIDVAMGSMLRVCRIGTNDGTNMVHSCTNRTQVHVCTRTISPSMIDWRRYHLYGCWTLLDFVGHRWTSLDIAWTLLGHCLDIAWILLGHCLVIALRDIDGYECAWLIWIWFGMSGELHMTWW